MKPSSAMALVSAMLGRSFSVFSAWEMVSFFVLQPTPRASMQRSAAINARGREAARTVCVFSVTVFIIVSFRRLIGRVISLHPFQRRCSPLAFQRFGFRPVEAQIHGKRSRRRGQPIGFLVFAG